MTMIIKLKAPLNSPFHNPIFLKSSISQTISTQKSKLNPKFEVFSNKIPSSPSDKSDYETNHCLHFKIKNCHILLKIKFPSKIEIYHQKKEENAFLLNYTPTKIISRINKKIHKQQKNKLTIRNLKI